MADNESLVSDEDVASLRTVLTVAKAEKWFGRTRADIAVDVGVTQADLDNFTSTSKQRNKPRSGRPHYRTLSRLLKFAAKDQRIAEYVGRQAEGSEVRFAYDVVLGAFQKLPHYSPDDDHLFLYLNRIHAMDVNKCLSMHELMSRYYYAYRFSTAPNRIIRSHFEIKPFHPSRKVPNFLHHLRYTPDGPVRQTNGQVLEIGGWIVFLGFVTRGSFDYDGVKLMVLDKVGFGEAKTLTGSFISFASRESGHHAGFIQLVATGDSYDSKMIGEFSLDTVQKDDPKFEVQAIRRSPSLNRGNLVTALT